MNSLLPFLISGLVSGSVYGLAGSGLVLTYKTSGVFNFAHGALATVAAYLFYTLHEQHGVSWPLSAVVCVLGVGVVSGLGFELFARRVVRTPVAQRIAGTVGALILVQAGATLIYGADPVVIKPFLPHGSFTVGGLVATVDQAIIVAVGVVLTLALYVFLQRSRLGTAMRAVVDDPELVSLSEFNPQAIRRLAWMVGCVLASLSGILIAPSLSLDPTQLTLLVVQAFGAAAIGRFVSLPITYAGGLFLGVVAAVCTKYVGSSGFLAGLPASIPFIVLFIVLVVTPKGRLRLSSVRRVPLRLSRARMPGRVQLAAALPAIGLAVFVPLLVPSHVLVWSDGLSFVILFASMVLLVRVAGQVSLCHVAFAAIGASTFAQLAGNHGWPWFVALLAAALVVVPVGALLAIPASRLPVLYLGLATLGFGLVVQQMFYSTNLMFSPFAQGLTVGRPHLGSLDMNQDNDYYYYLVLVLAVLCVGAISLLVRTRLGRILLGLSDSPLALSALGADERVTRVLVFCISAFFAGLSGAVYAGLLGNVSDTTFDPLASLTYLVVIVIAVGDPVWASIGAAIGIAVIPGYIESGNTSQYLQLAFGVIAIAVAAGPSHPTLPAGLDGWLRRLGETGRRTAADAADTAAAPAPSPDRPPADLTVRGMSVSFGGLRAVDDLSWTARAGAITGLIGPNGAGKTTTFNVCSGLVRPDTGQVLLDGQDVTRIGTARRARLGVGRSFQQPELFSSMTVLENIALGREASMAGANPFRHLVARPAEQHLRSAAVRAAVELCGVGPLLNRPASTLSTGQRRMVELARCLASPARVLLLDEPSAGLDPAETEAFGAILRRVVAERGLGILLVEHDMDLVMSICDYVYVLDFGRRIFEGEPAAVRASPIVQAAYLGDAADGLPAEGPAGPLLDGRPGRPGPPALLTRELGR